jgi:hypothetical protein
VAARFSKASRLPLKDGDRVVKVRCGLAQSGALNGSPDIRKSRQHVDDGPTIDQESKEMEVCPREKTAVVRFLREMDSPLSVLERSPLISLSPTHHRQGGLGLGTYIARRWCPSIHLRETSSFFEIAGKRQSVRNNHAKARFKPISVLPAAAGSTDQFQEFAFLKEP